MSAIQYINDNSYWENYFIFDGKSSADFRVIVSGEQTWGSPERDVEEIEIPGRNGNLIIDKKRYKNMELPYTCTILDNWADNYEAFKEYLMNHSNTYYRLEDTYHPKTFYMAKVESISDITYDAWIGGGTFTVTFNRKPQKFLKNEDPIEYIKPTDNSLLQLYNDTKQESHPLIHVYGSGNLLIGEHSISINGIDPSNYVVIDTETCEAYKNYTSYNKNVKFPIQPVVLKPGSNRINLGGTIAKILIYPRWWTL